MVGEFEKYYRAVRSRDARFDGWFYVGVTSTGIYCRPSCPAVPPKRPNARFYGSAASAQANGFRACKRCRPDAVPGSPEWNVRGAGRAMRLISDGVVDREGVAGLARRLGYTERHLGRVLLAEVGAGPLALARARRAHTARLLIETTEMPVSRVAFAAGFASVRQFNDTVRGVFAASPTELRRGRGRSGEAGPGEISLRLPYRAPLDAEGLLRFLGERAVPGVEEYEGGVYRRTIRLPHGAGVVALSDGGDHVGCALRLEDPRDLGVAVERCRRLLDLDADPVAIGEVLGMDPAIGRIVRRSPGRRVPGSVDGAGLATRAVLGQQVSVKGARTIAGRLVALCGEPVVDSLVGPHEGLTHLFPDPIAVGDADLESFGLPRTRREALRGLALALAEGRIVLDPGVDREEASRRLVEIRSIGPWTASYVAMHALGDPTLSRRRTSGCGVLSSASAVRGTRRPSPGSPNGGVPGGRMPRSTSGRAWAMLRWTEKERKRGRVLKAYVEIVESPAGPLALAVDGEGALLWLQFVEGDYEWTVESELEEEGYRVEEDFGRTARAREQLLEYHVGERREFGLLFVLRGTQWQKDVWEALTRIPYGETRTYGQIAATIGRPKSSRAVGRANATNKLPLVVPCHRVIGANGSLTGFAGGTYLKVRLLEHEARVLGGDDAGNQVAPSGAWTP